MVVNMDVPFEVRGWPVLSGGAAVVVASVPPSRVVLLNAMEFETSAACPVELVGVSVDVCVLLKSGVVIADVTAVFSSSFCAAAKEKARR